MGLIIKGRFFFWTAGSIQKLAFIPIGCTSNVAAMGSNSSGWVVGSSTWMREFLRLRLGFATRHDAWKK